MSKKIKVITGAIDSGKTTYARAMAAEKQAHGTVVGGILSIGFWEKGAKRGFFFYNILTGEQVLLCAEKGWGGEKLQKKDGFDTGRFFFNPEAFIFAEKALLSAQHADVMIIDELGKIEHSGGGLFTITKRLINEYGGKIVLVIRKELAEEIIHALNIDQNLVEYISV